MPKFIYCLICNYGLELETKSLGVCKCGNLMGKCRISGNIAEVYAKKPDQARFIGIPCQRERIMDSIIIKEPQIRPNFINEIIFIFESKGEPIDREILDKNPDCLRNMIIDFVPLCNPENIHDREISRSVKEINEWKWYNKHRGEFLEIGNKDEWLQWEKDHLVCTMDDWETFINRPDYCIGTIGSLKKFNWHRRWIYCEHLCSNE